MCDFEGLSNRQVADAITTWAGRVAAGEARLLELIAEFDRREAWAGVGILSCAHWLSWQLGMGMKAAHERVRVARALTDLPITRAAFQAGSLSWSQVRAITRVAVPADEQTYVGLAAHATGAQLERLVRGVRRAQKIREDESDPERAAHKRRARVSYDSDGDLVLTVRFPAEEGAVLLAAIEAARAELDRAGLGAGDGPGESSAEDFRPQASVADAVLHLARATLDSDPPATARRSRSRLVAQVDPISGWARLHDGELLPPAVVAAVLRGREIPSPCQGSAGDLTREDLNRNARQPSLALRELLGVVDGERCRFPGCTRHRRLHAHHVVYWSQSGRTDLANLVLLCGRHHTLVHSQGFQLDLRRDRTLHVATASGMLVSHHPQVPLRSAADLDPDQAITSTTLPPVTAGDRLSRQTYGTPTLANSEPSAS